MFEWLESPEEMIKDKTFSKAVRAVNAHVRARKGKPQAINFRPSEMGYLCPREYVFNYFDPQTPGAGEIDNLLYLESGSLLHEVIQQQIIGPMGLLWGSWAKDEDVQTECYQPSPEWSYVEQSFKQDLFAGHGGQVSGKLDGLLDTNRYAWFLGGCVGEPPEFSGKFVLWEFKITGSDKFREITSPQTIPSNHKIQVEIYQKLLGIEKAVFWYFDRNNFQRRFIEYTYSGEWWEHAKHKMECCVDAVEKKILPTSYMPCTDIKSWRAKKCPFAKQCFSGKPLQELVNVSLSD